VRRGPEEESMGIGESEWRSFPRKLGGNMPDEAAGFDEESLGWSALWDLAALREPRSTLGETAQEEAETEKADG